MELLKRTPSLTALSNRQTYDKVMGTLRNPVHKEEIPNLLQLASIALILPTSTAECERGFSVQNRIKTALRNRLTTSHLHALMTIDIEGPIP